VAAGRDLDGGAQCGVHCLAWQVPPNSNNYELNQESQEKWNQLNNIQTHQELCWGRFGTH